jgi:biotin transporter BioY
MEGYLFFGYVAALLCVATVGAWGVDMWRTSEKGRSRTLRRAALGAMCVMALYGTIRTYYFALHPGSRTAHHISWVQSETFWVLTIAAIALLISLGRSSTSKTLSPQEKIGLFFFIAIVTTFATLGIKDGGNVSMLAPELYRFVAKLPGFEGLRGLARMGILSVIAFILLAALGLSAFLKNKKLGTLLKQWTLVGGLSLLSAFELQSSKEPLAPAILAPPIYETATHLPTNEAVLALPTRSALSNGKHFMNWNSLHMIWMRHAKNRLVNGFSGKAPSFHSSSTHHLDSFPSRTALSMIGGIVGVRYVIINSAFYGEASAKKINILVKKYRSEIQLVACDNTQSCIYRVDPIIYSSSLPTKELLIPPGRHERTLSFDVKAEGETLTQPVTVTFEVNIGQKLRVSHLTTTLSTPSEWTPLHVQLPSNNEWVSPTVVTIKVEGAPGIMVRGTSLSPEP